MKFIVKVIHLHKENALLPNQKLQDDVFHLIKASLMFHIFKPVRPILLFNNTSCIKEYDAEVQVASFPFGGWQIL
jgi:hypothetical protein